MSRKNTGREKGSAKKDWPAKIISLMNDLAISRSELARRLRVSPGAVTQWLSGRLKPSVEIYIKLGVLATESPQGDFLWFWHKGGFTINELKKLLPALNSRLKPQNAVSMQQVQAIAVYPNEFQMVPLLNSTTYVHSPLFAPKDQIEMYLNLPKQFVPVGHEVSCIRLSGSLMSARLKRESGHIASALEVSSLGDILIIDASESELRHLFGTFVAIEFTGQQGKLQEGIYVGELRSDYGLLNENLTASLLPINFLPAVAIPIATGVRHSTDQKEHHVMWKQDTQFRILGRLIGWFAGEIKINK